MKAHSLPVLVCLPNDESKDENKKDKPVIEKSAQPKWMPEYEKYIKDKKPSLPIKIHPLLLMRDKDTAIAEYDRLYDIIIEIYNKKRTECYETLVKKSFDTNDAENASKQCALAYTNKFAGIVCDMYLRAWIDVQSINREDHIGISEDIQDIKHVLSALHGAKYIKILQDDNDRICAVRICGKSNNIDTIARGRFFGRTSMDKDSKDYIERWESEEREMLNDRLLNDILIRIEESTGNNVREMITPKHRNWDVYIGSIEYCLEERLNYWIEHKKSRYDIRKEKHKPISECKQAYQVLMDEDYVRYLPSYKGLTNHPSLMVASFICRILNLNVDAKTFVDIIQHS